MNNNAKSHIAVIYPAGKINEEVRLKSKDETFRKLREMNFEITEILPSQSSMDGVTSAPVMERVALLGYALTMRKFQILFAARGGMGCTELIPFLENILPPVIPDKILVGFSDISFLGVYLSLRYPNFKYIHAHLLYDPALFSGPMLDRKCLFDLLNNVNNEYLFPANFYFNLNKTPRDYEGICVPLNLSLAESLSSLQYLKLPKNNILFIEECNEYLYRIIRKFDSLINSNFLHNTLAIVVGSFSGILDSYEKPIEREFLLKILSKKVNKPIIDLPIFGHDKFKFPLVMNSKVKIKFHDDIAKITITNIIDKSSLIATKFPPHLFSQKIAINESLFKIHMTGIGGTGMAQVSGLFQKAGYSVSGSDNPIYPPMDKVISDLGIKPDIGFLASNITKNNPDIIVLANVVSRVSANLKKNEELEEILGQTIPMLSFPSALRKYFLHNTRNIVISGTHGKTTTSSLVTHLLTELGKEPSFLIGGRPANFEAGFSLKSSNIFVLEGDEYDSAFFDKGPKFLHYEPKICLINNIEFDHADIYSNVEAIENEFLNLAKLTKERNGILIVNMDDERCLRVAERSGANIIGFSYTKNVNEKFLCWKLISLKTLVDGTEIHCKKPNGKSVHFKICVFGLHNALNAVASLAILHASSLLDEHKGEEFGHIPKYNDKLLNFNEIINAMKKFKGVKRRFELLCEKNKISVFDDFAHHPTAIVATLEAFRSYMQSVGKQGNLIVCFDPRNATMRRKVLQEQLSKSFFHADRVFLGKVPQDMRMNKEEILDGQSVAKACGECARYFDDNEKLLEALKQDVKSGDTIVFMSSGSFDGIPYRFAKEL